jgi:hypothetical protein
MSKRYEKKRKANLPEHNRYVHTHARITLSSILFVVLLLDLANVFDQHKTGELHPPCVSATHFNLGKRPKYVNVTRLQCCSGRERR